MGLIHHAVQHLDPNPTALAGAQHGFAILGPVDLAANPK
jgi:hypothetical protein